MTDAATPRPATFTHRQLLLLGGCAVVAVILGWLGRQPPVTLGGDDSTYLLLAESLRQGRYVDLFLPGTPLHAQYPPGFPVLILLVQAIPGAGVGAIQAMNLMLLAATAWFVAEAVRRRFTPALGVAAAATIVLNPLLLHYAGWVLSETLFVACATTALCVLARPCRELRIRHWALAVILACAAFFTRSAGIVAVFAVVGGLVVCRRWRLALAGTSSLLLLAGWFSYTTWAARQTLGWSYANDLAYVRPTQAVDLLRRLLTSAEYYLAAIPRSALGIPDISDMPLDNAAWILLLLSLAALGLWHLWRRWPVTVLFTVLSAGVLLVFPFTVVRLIVPLIPVLIIAALVGTREVAAGIGAHQPERAAWALAGALCALALVRDVEAAVAQHRCRATDTGTCWSEAERSWAATAEWLRDQVPAGAVVASAKPSTLYRMTGHRGVPSRVLFDGNLPSLLAPVGPVTHIMATHLWSYERRDLPLALKEVCSRLTPLPTPHRSALVLAVLPPDAPPSTDGCQALLDFHEPAGTEADPR